MHTERLHIRKFRSDDLGNLFALLSDEEVMRYLEAPYTREAAEVFLRRCGMADEPLVYAVEDHSGAFVGYIIYHPYDADSYEIGWVLHRRDVYKRQLRARGHPDIRVRQTHPQLGGRV